MTLSNDYSNTRHAILFHFFKQATNREHYSIYDKVNTREQYLFYDLLTKTPPEQNTIYSIYWPSHHLRTVLFYLLTKSPPENTTSSIYWPSHNQRTLFILSIDQVTTRELYLFYVLTKPPPENTIYFIY